MGVSFVSGSISDFSFVNPIRKIRSIIVSTLLCEICAIYYILERISFCVDAS